jgi:pilus assembly protein Flp/PilA
VGTIQQEKTKMKNLFTKLYLLLQDERGQDLIEYALVVALIAFAATAGMNTVATDINQAFTNIGTKLTTYTS